MPLKVIKTKRFRVSPTTRASVKRDLPPQIPPEFAADIPVLRESDPVLRESNPVLQEMSLSELFANENVSESNLSESTIPSDNSWQIALSRKSARNVRQSSRASLRSLETTPAVPIIAAVTSIPFPPHPSAPIAETSTVDSQSSSISLDACLSTDVDTLSASSEAPDDVMMTDMQRRHIAHATLMARSLSSEQVEIRARLLGDQLRSIARLDEIAEPFQRLDSYTR